MAKMIRRGPKRSTPVKGFGTGLKDYNKAQRANGFPEYVSGSIGRLLKRAAKKFVKNRETKEWKEEARNGE